MKRLTEIRLVPYPRILPQLVPFLDQVRSKVAPGGEAAMILEVWLLAHREIGPAFFWVPVSLAA